MTSPSLEVSERLPPNAASYPTPASPKAIRQGPSGISSQLGRSAGTSFGRSGPGLSPGSDGDTFFQSVSIALDEPVGSMSMSPANRDVVLGARKGLFIVDLENPYDPPRFLAHSATWDVADVQWSPHPQRSSWVVSTSSQKALVWNLDLPYHSQLGSGGSSGPSSSADPVLPYSSVQSPIEFVLDAHTRSICDINCELDILATCGMDSWIYSFDLRTGGRKASQGFCAWGCERLELSCTVLVRKRLKRYVSHLAPATQVKWNRQDRHLIASSHDSRVLIWDIRKSANPLNEIKAHNEKIYGIDWSRRSSDGIVTCSLDKTVKFWSTTDAATPRMTIKTPSPVWRARHLPFGHGVMTLPQRSDPVLRMWSRAQLTEPIASFAGHSETVREFVWRTRGGSDSTCDDRQFQLVTWGQDRRLRLWPVSDEVLRSSGHRPGVPIDVRVTRKGSSNRSYRHSNLSHTFTPSPPTMSSVPFRFGGGRSGSAVPASTSPLAGFASSGDAPPAPRRSPFRNMRKPGFMTRATTTIARNAAEKRLEWMEGVKLYKKGDGLNGQDIDAPHVSVGAPGRFVDSLSRPPSSSAVDTSEAEPQNLGEELRAAERNLRRITFEAMTVSARTCSVGLYGPWAAHEGIAFLRATFTFPKSYPNRRPPTIEIERGTDISPRTRAFLLKTSRTLMQEHVADGSPALEACLKFLLGDRSFLKTEEGGTAHDSDSDDEGAMANRIDPLVLRNNTNVPLPRRAGACFGPHGQLVTFYSNDSRRAVIDRHPCTNSDTKQCYKFEAFGNILSAPFAEHDGDDSESDDALRIPKGHRDELRASTADPPAATQIVASRRISTKVNIRVVESLRPMEVVDVSSADTSVTLSRLLENARNRGDTLRERLWTTLDTFLGLQRSLGMVDEAGSSQLVIQQTEMLREMLVFLALQRDIETLGMIACVLEMHRRSCPAPGRPPVISTLSPRDYFNHKPTSREPASLSPTRYSSHSPMPFRATPDAFNGLSSSFSPSKASWGSLGAFFSNSVFSLKSASPPEPSSPRVLSGSIEKPSALRKSYAASLAASQAPQDSAVAILKQLRDLHEEDSLPKRAASLPAVSFDARRTSIPRTRVSKPSTTPKRPPKKQKVIKVTRNPNSEDTAIQPMADPLTQSQLELHRLSLADLLHRRSDPLGRTAVLQTLRANDEPGKASTIAMQRAQMASGIDSTTRIELGPVCRKCEGRVEPMGRMCMSCGTKGMAATCAICTLRVDGFSQNCARCLHGGHVSCLTDWFVDFDSCPAGCDCSCASNGGLAGVFHAPDAPEGAASTVPGSFTTAEADTSSFHSLSTVRVASLRKR